MTKDNVVNNSTEHYNIFNQILKEKANIEVSVNIQLNFLSIAAAELEDKTGDKESTAWNETATITTTNTITDT